jgi:hypothetical protein
MARTGSSDGVGVNRCTGRLAPPSLPFIEGVPRGSTSTYVLIAHSWLISDFNGLRAWFSFSLGDIPVCQWLGVKPRVISLGQEETT